MLFNGPESAAWTMVLAHVGPGKPTQPRTEHLRTLRTPTLICQGTRGPFGNRAEVQHYPLSQSIRLC